MNKLFAYFTRNLVITILVVWLVLLVFDVAFAFFGELSDVGKGRYGLPDLFQVISLSIPRRVYELFPMAALIGAMLGIGNFAARGELVAARSAGLSRGRLITWVLVNGMLLLLTVIWVGESVAPAAEQRANVVRAQALFERVAVQNDRDIWIRDGNRYMRIGAISEHARLQDIEVYEFAEDHQLIRASKINAARLENDSWRLDDVQQTLFRPANIDVVNDKEQTWQHLIDPELVKVLTREPQYMTLFELRHYISYLTANNVGSSHYQLDFWSRLARPLTVLTMLLLGIGFVLSANQRQSNGWRLFLGVVTGLLFKLFNDLFAQAGLVYGLSPLLSALLPTLLVAGCAVWLLRSKAA